MRLLLLRLIAASALAVALASTATARADLIGTSVAGVFNFTGAGAGMANYFDAANNYVPRTGYLNSNPGTTTVTISQSYVEFGVNETNAGGPVTFAFNFTGSQLIVTDSLTSPFIEGPFRATFTDSAFSGLNLTQVSSNFPAYYLFSSLSGNVVTLEFLGSGTGNVPTGTYTATFNLLPSVAAVPEPSPLALAGMAGALGLVGAWRRKRAG